MKTKILKILREAGNEYVSSSKFCEKLGISRQAIWKNISSLKEMGYNVESVSSKGYRLVDVPDKLYGPYIESQLQGDCLCQCVKTEDVVDSTNNWAKKLAEDGAKEGTLAVAEEQTAGKGRRGREWKSKPNTGIWMSLILRPDIDIKNVSGITLLSALAIVRAIEKNCKVRPEIKWPNDVVIDGKKICGILTEMSSEENYIHYVIVGIGVNANTDDFPDEIKDTASSIYKVTGKKVDRTKLLVAIMEEFSDIYKVFVRENSLKSFVDDYNSVLANNNKQVKIYYGMKETARNEKIDEGIARGIDEDGALIVEIDGEIKKIVSGEVSVRGLYGYV